MSEFLADRRSIFGCLPENFWRYWLAGIIKESVRRLKKGAVGKKFIEDLREEEP